MRTLTVQQAKAHFGTFIDMAQKSPVRVVRDDRVVGVMVSGTDYEAMRVFYADRLVRTLERTAGLRRRVKTVWPRLRQTQFWLKPWLSIKVAIQRCGRHLQTKTRWRQLSRRAVSYCHRPDDLKI